jgi:hypothetical protein
METSAELMMIARRRTIAPTLVGSNSDAPPENGETMSQKARDTLTQTISERIGTIFAQFFQVRRTDRHFGDNEVCQLGHSQRSEESNGRRHCGGRSNKGLA